MQTIASFNFTKINATRTLTNSYDLEYCCEHFQRREHFQRLEIITLTCLYLFETSMPSIITCKLVTGNDSIHCYNTRHISTFRQTSHRLKLFKTLPSKTGANFLKNIPECITSIQSVNLFKAHLKDYWERCLPYCW